MQCFNETQPTHFQQECLLSNYSFPFSSLQTSPVSHIFHACLNIKAVLKTFNTLNLSTFSLSRKHMLQVFLVLGNCPLIYVLVCPFSAVIGNTAWNFEPFYDIS